MSADRTAQGVRKVYVVQRLHWQYNDNWYECRNDEPVKAFADRDLAEVYRLEQEEAHRWCDNPCRFAGGLARASSLLENELLARLDEMGLPHPPAETLADGTTSLDWWDEDWWEDAQRRLLDSERQALWALFDRVRFFEVIETELEAGTGDGRGGSP